MVKEEISTRSNDIRNLNENSDFVKTIKEENKVDIIDASKKKTNTKYADFKNSINILVDGVVSSNNLFYNKDNLKS